MIPLPFKFQTPHLKRIF